jgi:hypothetical protein
MIYKSYKFKDRNGQEFKVRFYFTGIYTFVDCNGEHEIGMWWKEPLMVGKHNDKPSKDRNNVRYHARPFSQEYAYRYADFSLGEVARRIAIAEIMRVNATL